VIPGAKSPEAAARQVHPVAFGTVALIQSLSAGPQQLRQALLPWQVERASMMTSLGDWAKQLAQAEVNMQALGRF
jgi:hypothetical protein